MSKPERSEGSAGSEWGPLPDDLNNGKESIQMQLPFDFEKDDWFYRAVAEEMSGRVQSDFSDAQRAGSEDSDRFVYGNGLKGQGDGKYFQFGAQGIFVIKFWPLPQAWHKGPPKGQWRGICPHLDLVARSVGLPVREPALSFRKWTKPWVSRTPAKAVFKQSMSEGVDPFEIERRQRGFEAAKRAEQRAEEAFSWVPKEVARIVRRFRFRQWHLLSLVARCPEALELLESNPALGFALASANVFHPTPERWKVARRLIGKPRRKISEWLGFAGTESAVKLLARIPPDNCGVTPLLALRKSLEAPEIIGRLRHLPRLPAVAMLLMGNRLFGPRVTDSFLRQVVEASMNGAGEGIGSFLSDCFFLSQQSETPLPARIASVSQLRRWHDRLVEEINRRELTELMKLPFPEPPLPGGTGIEPILSPAELLAEGRTQHHCVAAFIAQVAKGEIFFYRVTAPERATLSLERSEGGRWEIGQLVAACNEPVTPTTARSVKKWYSRVLRSSAKLSREAI